MEDPSTDRTRAAVQRFNDSFNAHDLGALAALVADDIVFENTNPAPDGTRYEGKPRFLEFFEAWFAANPDARFDSEEVIVAGGRCVVRWVYRKSRDGRPWHVRGVDLFTVRGGLIAEKLSYVKG